MNKLLILVLAICLVSVHAFVKRDAPEAPTTENTLMKQLEDLAKTINTNLKEAFDPENIKEKLAGALQNLNAMGESLKPKDDTPK